jgi:enoyl-[acyl-carrier protein] reductase I
MQLLKGQKGVILGVANDRSIAWAIAEEFHKQGAEIALNYVNPKLGERVIPLGQSIGAKIIKECNVCDDSQLDSFFAEVKNIFGEINFLIHSVAFAEKQDLEGGFVNTSRKGFITALEVSAFSFVAATKAALPILKNPSSVMTMTYNGSQRVMPNYNVMGVAKAALESATRYLAYDLGQKGIRVNSVSPGPLRTLSSSGIANFKSMLHQAEELSPLKRNISAQEVAKTCVYLASDLSSGVTGENIFVDAGQQIMGI